MTDNTVEDETRRDELNANLNPRRFKINGKMYNVDEPKMDIDTWIKEKDFQHFVDV